MPAEHNPILVIGESTGAGNYDHGHPPKLLQLKEHLEPESLARKPEGGWARALPVLSALVSRGGGSGAAPPVPPIVSLRNWGSGGAGVWGNLCEHPFGGAGVGRSVGRSAAPCRPRPRRLAAGEHSREAGVGPAPRGRERGLLWKRFCIRIKS